MYKMPVLTTLYICLSLWCWFFQASIITAVASAVSLVSRSSLQTLFLLLALFLQCLMPSAYSDRIKWWPVGIWVIERVSNKLKWQLKNEHYCDEEETKKTGFPKVEESVLDLLEIGASFLISSSLHCGFCILNKHGKFNYHSPSISQFKSTFSTPITHKFNHWCPDLIRRNLFPHFFPLSHPIDWSTCRWHACHIVFVLLHFR